MMGVELRPAAAVVLLRDDASVSGLEVFMVRRVTHSSFMPDVYVFPGGALAQEDRQVEMTPGICNAVPATAVSSEPATALGSGLRVAALRELFEEANVLLAYRQGMPLTMDGDVRAHFIAYRQALQQGRQRSLLALAQQEQLIFATDQLICFAHWITPEGMAKRFDTYFFLARLPRGQEAAYDQLETSEGVWIAPTQALTCFAQGTFPLAFPTFHQLTELSHFSSVRQALAITAEKVVPTHQPVLRQNAGRAQVYLPEDPEQVWNV